MYLFLQEQLDIELKALETCNYGDKAFKEILERVQKSVDQLSLYQYSNLPQWVATLDEAVERRLSERLEVAIKMWTKCLVGKSSEEHGLCFVSWC